MTSWVVVSRMYFQARSRAQGRHPVAQVRIKMRMIPLLFNSFSSGVSEKIKTYFQIPPSFAPVYHIFCEFPYIARKLRNQIRKRVKFAENLHFFWRLFCGFAVYLK